MKDIFGKALFDYWKGKTETPFFLREKGGTLSKSSVQPYFDKKLFRIEEKVLKFAKGKILDIGCGAGRHVLYLQMRKFDVVGIDISPKAVRVCKARGCKKVKVANVYKFNSKDTFDTLILLGRNIGMGGTISGTKKLFKKLNTLANKNALLLLTDFNANEMGKSFYVNKIRIEYGNLIGDWFNWIRFSPDLITQIGNECGWATVKIYKEKGGNYAAVLKKK